MGVLVHSGGADAGHYYSYIKERVPSQVINFGGKIYIIENLVENNKF